MSWAEGDRVEVYDPDADRWHTGVVESTFTQIAGRIWTVVETDSARAYDLPLKIAVPSTNPEWIRAAP